MLDHRANQSQGTLLQTENGSREGIALETQSNDWIYIGKDWPNKEACSQNIA